MDKEQCERGRKGEGIDPVTGSDVSFHEEIFDVEFEDRVNRRMIEIIRMDRNRNKMYLWDDLKPIMKVTNDTVECPVKNCEHIVARAKRGMSLRAEKFRCPEHQIFISPSTFEYEDPWRNLTERTPDDKALMDGIEKVKRESRLARNNSEDAITWSVFRYFEKHGVIDEFSAWVTGKEQLEARIVYWSYSRDTKQAWHPLETAREIFGESMNRSTEPDIIIETDNSLIFVECKIGSNNRTRPSNLNNPKKYETGGDSWFQQVFTSGESFKSIAVHAQKYELMRLWLLGTWIADKKLGGKQFVLLNLVLDSKEKDIEQQFGSVIHQNNSRRFRRMSWEQIYQEIPAFKTDDVMRRYFTQKTLGYKNGRLTRMFGLAHIGE